MFKYSGMLLLLAGNSFAQELFTIRDSSNFVFETLKESPYITTGYLYDKTLAAVDAGRFNGNDNAGVCNATMFKQLIWQHEHAFLAENKHGADGVQNLDEKEEPYIGTDIKPIAILLAKYDTIRQEAFESNWLIENESGQLEEDNPAESPYGEMTVAAASLLTQYINFSDIKFVIDPELVFNTTGYEIQSMEIDMGEGFEPIDFNQEYFYEYSGEPVEMLVCSLRITLDDETVLYTYFGFNYTDNIAPPSPDYWKLITTNISFTKPSCASLNTGQYGQAEYYIKYAANNTQHQLKKPLIFVEGFDPKLGHDAQNFRYGDIGWDVFLSGGYQANSAEPKYPNLVGLPGLISELTGSNHNYDIVYVDFVNGGDYIQKNAFALVSVLQDLLSKKVGNEEMVVIGTSMGGLLTRYALSYIEKNNLPHCVRLWLSFDAPHNGANIPVGLQAGVNFFANFKYEAEVGNASLVSPAALQMLMRNLGAVKEQQLYNEACYRNNLKDILDNIGFPEQLRKIAILNGSATTNGVGNFGFTEDVCNVKYYKAGKTRLQFNVNTQPATGENIVFMGAFTKVEKDWWPPAFNATTWSRTARYNCSGNCPNYDGAPGGMHSGVGDFYAATKHGLWDEEKEHPTFDYLRNAGKVSFIPSVSALAIKPGVSTDLFYNIAANINNANYTQQIHTPFEAYTFDTDLQSNLGINNDHVTPSIGNAIWILDQLKNNEYRIPSALPSIYGEQFNVATYHQRLLRSVEINDDGVIQINGNYKNYYGQSSDLDPITGSTIALFTTQCNPAQINVNNGGRLILGDNNSGINNKALVNLLEGSTLNVNTGAELLIYGGSVLTVRTGAVITIKNNAMLNVSDNSKLIIEPGAFLIFESGASINLNGDNAQLSIAGGALEIKDNATFTFTGSGFISFGGSTNVAMGTNTHFYLNGSGQNDKVLELTNNAVVNFPYGTGTTKKFTATNCNIDLNSGILEIKSDLYLSDVKIIGTGIYQTSGTLKTYGQNPVDILNSTFDYVSYYANQADADGVSLSIDNCVFDNAGVGVYDKGFTIENSTFNQSSLGIGNLIFPSIVKNTNFNNVTSAAIYYDNLINATPVLLDNVTINGVNSNGSMGVTVSGGLLQLKCTQINVDISAIDMYTGAQLNMSTQNGGLYNRNILSKSSSNSFESEPLINTYEAGVIYLDEGQNVLKKLSTSKYIGGTFNNTQNMNIEAEYNKWHPSLLGANTMPVVGNFNLSSITQGKTVTIDFSTISTSTLDACGSQSSMMSFTDPCDGPFGCSTSSNLLDNCPSCSNLKIGGVPIHKKLKKMLREIALDTLKVNLDNNINRLDSIVNFVMLGNSSAVEKIKDMAYDNYIQLYQEKLYKNQQMSQIISLNTLSSKVMNSTNSRINKAIADNDSARIVKYLLSKASLYLNKNDDYTTPYNLLKTALNYTLLNAGMYSFIKQQMCIISTEGLYVNKVISSTEFDSLKNECKILYSIKPTASRVLIQNEKELLIRNQETVLDLYPNPTSTILNINLKNALTITHNYKVMDISGRVMLMNNTEQTGNFSLDISELSQGVYMLEIEGGGFVKTGRFVIVR